jgi:hypothetical protein
MAGVRERGIRKSFAKKIKKEQAIVFFVHKKIPLAKPGGLYLQI